MSSCFPRRCRRGRFFRVELYGVVFPAAGGAMQCTGSYTLADGHEHDVDGIPAVEIESVTPFDQFKAFLEEQPWVEAWNSNTFLRLFFNPVLIVSSLPIIFGGFLMSVAIVLAAFPLAIPFGFLFALMRISKSRILRALAAVYVNLIRGTPAFLQIYIAFFGLPLAGVNIDNYTLGRHRHADELRRLSVRDLPCGHPVHPQGSVGGRPGSLGMSAAQTMVSIIIPQTFRNVIPTLTSEFILLYKDTSLLAAVGVMEIVMYAKTIVATTRVHHALCGRRSVLPRGDIATRSRGEPARVAPHRRHGGHQCGPPRQETRQERGDHGAHACRPYRQPVGSA